jgi:CheY-like chemotaxis protein
MTDAPARLTVLLVEDNESNRDMLTRRLEKRGYRVITASTGAAALAFARTRSPAIILLDLRLPDIDGWEVSRTLKIDPATAPIPIIATSAHAQDSDRAKALSAGCNEFEPKPIDLDRLLDKIRGALGTAPNIKQGSPNERL